jgi:hypothetical protein
MDTQTDTLTSEIATEDHAASPEALWVARLCTANLYTHPKIFADGRYACVAPFLFTHAILLGRIGEESSYEDRWCYGTAEKAIQAIEAWDGTGEPNGWHRHPLTGRRRSQDGVEYINP